jgi:hypothetical protein
MTGEGRLAGKAALVTGGSRGIGADFADATAPAAATGIKPSIPCCVLRYT